MRTLFYKFFDRAIDWIFRARNIGVVLLGAGITLLAVAFSIDFLAQIDFRDALQSFSFKFNTGEGMPRWANFVAYGLGCLMTLMGIGVLGYQAWTEIQRDRRQKNIIVELRGLHSSPDTPAKDAKFLSGRGARHWVLVDFRPQRADALVDPDLMLEKIRNIKPMVHSLADGRDKSDVSLAVGGLAAVPALFLTGILVEDESAVTLFDWARDPKEWRLIEGPDDGTRFLPLCKEVGGTVVSEAVLAVAVSYPIESTSLNRTFPSQMPIFRLTAENVVGDRHWSDAKQQALARGFRDAVQELMALGIQKIHLVLAAPASLSIRLGTTYDCRLMPELLVYQFEKSCTPPYPWAVRMPTHGRVEAEVIRTPLQMGQI